MPSDTERDCRFMYDFQAGQLFAFTPGMNYRVTADGTTFFRTDNGFEVPAPGCPFPRELATLNAILAFRSALRWLPAVVLAASAWVVSQWFMWSIPDSPADEFKANFIALFSWWMNVGLIVLAVLSVLSVALWTCGHTVRAWILSELSGPDTDTKLLQSGPDISPDIFVMSLSEFEPGQEFADRMAAAEAARRRGQWVVAIAFRNPSGIILTGGSDCCPFHRSTPDYQRTDWPEESKIVPPGFRFHTETWAQYLQYCNTFARHYPEWAAAKKLSIGGNPVKAFTDSLRAESVTLEI